MTNLPCNAGLPFPLPFSIPDPLHYMMPLLSTKIATTTTMAAAPLLTFFTLAFISLNNFMLGSSTVIDWKCNTSELGNNRAYGNNVRTVLHNLVDRGLQFGALREGEALNDTNAVFGLFQCIGDVSQYDCNLCGQEATYFLRQKCPHAAGAALWSNWCFLRFESYDFFSKLETPRKQRKPPCREPDGHTSRGTSKGVLQNLMQEVCGGALQEKMLFATKSVGGTFLNSQVEIKARAQCWKDLSNDQCGKCLAKGMKEMEKCYNGRNSKADYFSENCFVGYVMTLVGNRASNPGGRLRDAWEKSLKGTDGNGKIASDM